MKIAQDVVDAARSVGAAEGVAPAVLLAVAFVETGARPFAVVGGAREPLIRFEGHYFDRLVAPSRRLAARNAGLAHRTAGQIRNPSAQTARWAMLKKAAAIDRDAAWQSTSWGLGQVMGKHWRHLGFADVAAFVAQARASADGQFLLMARFLEAGGLPRLLTSGETQAFARRYNGPAFARNGYDTKIASAYTQAIDLLHRQRELSIGARGAAVTILQRGLVAAGHAVAVDGAFGPLTQAALRLLQEQAGLEANGQFDQATRRHMALYG